jgi:hypothetical protein
MLRNTDCRIILAVLIGDLAGHCKWGKLALGVGGALILVAGLAFPLGWL